MTSVPAVLPPTTLALAPNPLQPVAELRQVQMLPGETLAAFLARQGVHGEGWIVSVGGWDVPCAHWGRIRVKHGQVIEARALVRKSALRIVAVIALIYFTMGTGGIAGGSFLGMTGFSGYAAASVAFLAGTAVINRVLGSPTRRGPDAQTDSPTYALQGGRNQARLYEPLNLVLGETKVVPEYASQSYTWFEGDDQYLSCTFHAGLNCASVADIKIGATAITQYENVTLIKRNFPSGNTANAPVNLTSVDAIAGALLDNPAQDGSPGTWVVRTSSVATIRLAVDIEGSLFRVNGEGKQITDSCDIGLEYRLLPGGAWSAFSGASSTVVLTHAGTKPLRQTFTRDVPSGQYEVRARKQSANPTDPNQTHNIVWNVLKSYQADTADYGSQPVVNIEIKASGQLNGSLDEVNWVARAEPLPYWNGNAWVTVSAPGANGISNPGAIILALLRGAYRASDGRRLYGAGLSDSRIDIESLQGFMVRCAAKSLRFDAVIQETMSLGDLLEAVAYVGLGAISRHNGKVGVIWMAEDQPIEGVVNMAAMKAKSFGVDYNLSATADEISLEFFDPANNWTWQPVRVKAPGVTGTPQRSTRTNVLGVTGETHAAVLARLAMAQNIYGRKSISFDLDLEHLTFRRYSLLSISHDLTQWGYGGRVRSVTLVGGGASFTVSLDEPVPTAVPSGGSRHVGLRLAGEAQMRVFPVASVSGDGYTLTVGAAWPGGAAVPGGDEIGQGPAHDALWMYDFKATPGNKVRIVSITPASNLQGAKLVQVEEGPEFWNYVWTGAYVPPPNNSLLSTQLPVASRLQLTEERSRQGDTWYTELTVTFDVAGNYDHGQVWAAVGDAPLEKVGPDIYGVRASWRVTPGQVWRVQVRPYDGLGRLGTVANSTHTVDVPPVAPVAALELVVTATGIQARWPAPTGANGVTWVETEVRRGASFDAGAVLFKGRALSCNLGWLASGTLTVWAVHRDSAGNTSDPITASLVISPPGQPALTGTVDMSVVRLAWTDCRTTQPVSCYQLKKGTDWATGNSLGQVDALSITLLDLTPGLYTFWATAVDVGGNAGTPGHVDVHVGSPISETLAQLNAGLADSVNAINELGNSLGGSIDDLLVDVNDITNHINDAHIGLQANAAAQSMLALGLQSARELLAASDLQQLLLQASTRKTMRDAGIAVDAATGQVHIEGVDQNAYQLSKVKADFDAIKSQVTLQATRITQLNTDLVNAVLDPTGAAVVAGVITQINDVRVQLDAINAAIELKASTTVVAEHYTMLQAAINTLNATGSDLLVIATTISALQTDLTAANSRLLVLENSATSNTELIAVRLGDQHRAERQDAETLAALLQGVKDKTLAAKQLAYAQDRMTVSVAKLGEATAQKFTALATQVDHSRADWENSVNLLTTALSTEITARQALAATQVSDKAALQAALLAESTARVADGVAEANARLALAATVAADKSSAEAAISQEASVRASNDAAEANARFALAVKQESDRSSLQASISQEASARTTADTAEVNARQALAVKQESDRATLQAAVDTEQSARVSGDQASAAYTNSVQAAINNTIAGISQRLAVVVNANGQVVAAYTLALNANGRIIGMRLDNNGTVGNFVVQADKFAFVLPGANSEIPVFVAGVVNGVNTFGINGQLMVDGSVYARALNVDRLSALTAKMGNLSSGTLTIESDGGSDWGYARSAGKWLGDGVSGWVLARHPNGSVFTEIRSGSCRFWMTSWNDSGIEFPGVRMTPAGLEISQINVIDTLNIKGNAITVPASATGYGAGCYLYLAQPGSVLVTCGVWMFETSGSDGGAVTAAFSLQINCSSGAAGGYCITHTARGRHTTATTAMRFDLPAGGWWFSPAVNIIDGAYSGQGGFITAIGTMR